MTAGRHVTTSTIVIGRPYPQGSMRAFNSIVVQGGSETSRNNLKAWRNQIAAELTQAHMPRDPYLGPCTVDLTFRFKTPKTRAKRTPEGHWRAIPPDLDKLVRAVLDAATEAQVWKDDAQVVDLIATKTETHGAEGVAITIRELP